MAFKRSTLKAMGLTDEQVDSIVELHSESVNALKAEIEKFKDEADKLTEVQEKLDKAQKELDAAKKDDYKTKYETEKAAHDKLKSEIASNETKAKKATALKALLSEKEYSESGIAKILKYGGYADGIELDENGTIKDSDKVMSSIEAEWSEYKPTKGTTRHTPVTPPVGGKIQKSIDDIMKIEDTAARQKALAEHIHSERSN